jgi:hypothetical protein
MAKDNEFDWLDRTGSGDFKIEEANAVSKFLDSKAKRFLLDVQKNARKYKLIGSGKLVGSGGNRVKITKQGSLTFAEFYLIYYGFFQNYGVKGWGDSKNAPDSPYQFKSKGMDEAGVSAIRKMIMSGRKKTKNVKYKKVGLERKGKDGQVSNPIDTATNQAVWNIKKYGIKSKPFYTEAWNKHFGKFDNELFTAMKRVIVAELLKD